jgi:serine protease Do
MFSLLFAGLIYSPSLVAAQKKSVTTIAAIDPSDSLQLVTRLTAPAVVEIFTTSYVPAEGVVSRAADLVTTRRASGSGVIVDPDGYIITNAHVVAGAHKLRVELPSDGRTVSAEVVGIDIETDIAVIKVEERNLRVLTFGDSDELQAGQVVLALGSPLGFHNSVSFGVVSAVARQFDPDSSMQYIQTDASINPGSSGGPLVDLRGKLVGINTMIVSQTGGNEGLAFAAPSNIVRGVYEQIRAFGHVRRSEMGIRIQTVTPVLASGLGLVREEGVIAADVFPGSPAAQAGIIPGDMILSFNSKPLLTGHDFQSQLYRNTPGTSAVLEVMRGGSSHKLFVGTVERPVPPGPIPSSVDPRDGLVAKLGILGVTLDQQIAQMLPVMRVRSGVVVASTVEGAIEGRQGGLLAGDIIYALNRTRVLSLAELRTALDNLKPGDAVVLQLERRGALMYLAFFSE